MKKRIVTGLFTALAVMANAQSFTEWQNPEVNAVNRAPMHTNYFAYESEGVAQTGVKEHSSRFMTLNGTWKFFWVKDADARPVDFWKPGFNDKGWCDMAVPGVWELNGFGDPIYVNVGYAWRNQFKNNPPQVPVVDNHVGSYRREIVVPATWKGKDIIAHFGSVTSNMYLWVNGKYVGYSEDSKLEAEFDLTSYLKPGQKNLIAFQVFRWCDGTSASYAPAADGGTWTININASTTMADINQAIKKAIADDAALAAPTYPTGINLSCTSYTIPSAATVADVTGGVGADFALVRSNAKVGSVSATAGQAGEFANDYKVVFKYVSNYDAPSAQWDDNTLTISVTNKEYTDDADFVADVNAAITAAAGGNSKKLFTFDAGSFEGIKDLTNGQRKQLFGGNPSLSFGGGEDSFYTTVAKNLSTFNLTDGRKGGEQTYKDLENVTVQQDGTIIGKHAVHGYLNLGRIDIATFDNPNGLSAVGGTLFEQTVASGEPKVAIAGQEGAGEVVSGALEMSNVDLAQEFTDMITTQRGYQANSRVITTSDTMLEELLSLKR